MRKINVYSIFIMEEKAVKPTKIAARLPTKSGTVQYVALGYVSATRRDIPDRRNTTTLTMC
jgi:hypothetical protein